jgi:Zn-dependent protease with chaperone function
VTGKTSTSRTSVAKPVAAKAQPPKVRTALSGVELATAFDGRMAKVPTPMGYRLAILAVFCAMVLLPGVYLGILALALLGIRWYAIHALPLFDVGVGARGMLLIVILYAAPLIAGGLLVAFLILPLFWKSKKRERPLWVDRREQPLLYAYIDKLCEAIGAPRPARIDVTPSANASAHIDNGLLGLVGRRLVLTIGLPLAQSLDLRQFTGVLAHELGHFRQGMSMRLSYIVFRINGWFFRLAHRRSGLDDAVDSFIGNEPHWTMALIGVACKLMLGLTRLVLMGMALLSHALSMHLSRQAEYDADRVAARIAGGDAMAEVLQALPFISAASEKALAAAQRGWSRHRLPDDLVVLTDGYRQRLAPEVRSAITAKILSEDDSYFDSHPPLFKRVALMKLSTAPGVLKLDAPATLLFKDFDELCKISTISFYQSVLGARLQPEHLVPTAFAAAPQQAKAGAKA